jgi:hypothetical protein
MSLGLCVSIISVDALCDQLDRCVQQGSVCVIDGAPLNRDLMSVAKRRPNVVLIEGDVQNPDQYAAIPQVDVIVADLSRPDQSQILGQHAVRFLRPGGKFMLIIDAARIDATVSAYAVFHKEVTALRMQRLKPHEQVTLEPFFRNYAVVRAPLMRGLMACTFVLTCWVACTCRSVDVCKMQRHQDQFDILRSAKSCLFISSKDGTLLIVVRLVGWL